MASAGKAGLGIGTAAAGGAASGAAFGPIGAGIGAGIGGLLGLVGAFDDGSAEAEAELRRRRDQARKMAVVEALRNKAAQYGAPTDRVDMQVRQQQINDQYQQGMDQLARSQEITPQDYLGLAQNLAAVGGNVKKWAGTPAAPPQGALMRNSDLYGSVGNTGLVRGEDPLYNSVYDPMMRRR